MSALEAILVAVLAEYREPLEAKSSAKEAWEAIATLISKLRSHGVTIDEEDAVSKYFHSELAKYIQIALSIETMLNLSTLTIEDVIGRLRTVDEHMEQATATKDSGKLLLTEEWDARRNFREASSSRGGDGKCRGKASSEKKKVDPNVDDDDEATLLMATFCALHDVEAELKGEVTAVEGNGKALKAVHLNELRAQIHLGRVGGGQEQRWYLDSGASSHMTGSKKAFSELDSNVTSTVKFGDGSRVAIRGRGTIIFRC
ncbi:uncharacterized protein [Miscanthus floridulus]|uniref:uncharacterized protein n=1 Tax=Miscanthus floridulus TaxID=154761 RepID=UPI00345B1EC4